MNAPSTTASFEDHLQAFNASGYVIIRGLLDPARDFAAVRAEYEEVLDGVAAESLAEGKIATYDRSRSFEDRLLAVIRQTDGACAQHMDISLPLNGDVDDRTPMHTGPAVFELMRNKTLLDAVERFIGPEIYSNPVQHVRFKPPEHLMSRFVREQNSLIASTRGWHQDLGGYSEDANDSDILSVWFPILEATEENGCLVVVHGSHKTNKLLPHHCSSTLNGIPTHLVGEPRVPLPMQPGDVLFLHRLTTHAAFPNRSQGLRWSFDLRYNPTGQATGRSWFPGFVARSRANPASELTDPRAWAASWARARAQMAVGGRGRLNRWEPNELEFERYARALKRRGPPPEGQAAAPDPGLQRQADR